ncbi:hypothetical protein F5887DRAFT_1082848 [Amanita rubescens]|nr:hypothetical protein F5887DRAFT_1082848 [Amanita rubescens]
MSGTKKPCEFMLSIKFHQLLTSVDKTKPKGGQVAMPIHTQEPSGNSATDVMKEATGTVGPSSAFPINRFAREILTEIFWNCLPKVAGPAGWMSSSNAPLLLCRVCSSWRSIVLDTPKLWTTVAINIRKKRDPQVVRQVINSWLERSRNLPLRLYLIYGQMDFSRTKDDLLGTILSVFYSHSSRWQRVHIHLSHAPTLSFPQLDAPLLQSFMLLGTWDGDEDEPLPLPFNNSPHLKQLDWPFPIDVPANPHIRWSRITNLRISSGMTYFTALEAIRLCPKLEKFDVDVATAAYNAGIDRDDDSRLPLNPIVENRSLRTLKFLTFDDCSPFLNSLTLPEMKDFTLEVFIMDEMGDNEPRQMLPPEHQAFLGLLTRSGCQLDRLKLGHCGFTSPAVIECLEHKSLETIQSLTIANLYNQRLLKDDVFIRLSIPSSPPSRVLLPKLTHLTFELCLAASPGALGRMVNSRRFSWKEHGAEQLKSLSVIGKLKEEDTNLISKAVSDGLNASIKEGDPDQYGLNDSDDNPDGNSDDDFDDF